MNILFTPNYILVITIVYQHWLNNEKRILEEEKNMKDIFSKHWDDHHGFTYAEALEKKAKVDDGHGVGTPTSRWKESVIEPDPERKDGYRVVIETKPRD